MVSFIFKRYLNGDSLGKIAKALEQKEILSPTGKTKWNKETINKLISNEKYAGEVMLQKTHSLCGMQFVNYGQFEKVVITNHNPSIISKELFGEVQELK